MHMQISLKLYSFYIASQNQMYILLSYCMHASTTVMYIGIHFNLLSGLAILNLTLYHITPTLKVICVDSPQFAVRYIQNSYLAAVFKLIFMVHLDSP